MPDIDADVHPVAALFPLMADDELKELAADIAERGLIQPIVLDKEERILDGRNRFLACRLAGVKARYVTFDGDDPDGYAMATNIHRRNMSKGQQAIVVARAMRADTSCISQRDAAKTHGIPQPRIAAANVILDHAPDLADAILTGGQKFDAAYTDAKARKTAADNDDAKLTKLRDEASDLADKVADEELTLAEAWAAKEVRDKEVAQRAEEERQSRIQIHTKICKAMLTAGSWDHVAVNEVMADYDADDLDPPQLDRYLELPHLEAAQRFVAALIEWRRAL